LWRFTLAVFAPHVYLTYAVLWVLALESSASLLAHGNWRPSAGTLVRAVSVVLALLYLRIVDEQKDLVYDRQHNPERPLVKGDIGHGELRAAMAAITIALVLLNAWLSLAALAVLVVDLGYALLLFMLEQRSPRIRDELLLNLAVTYPVQLLLSVYVYLSAAGETGGYIGWRAVPLLAIFVCVFMHFEFARKTAWGGADGARLYSAVLGPARSARLAAGFAVGAALLTLALFWGWPAALLPLVFPTAGLLVFLRRRVSAWPVPLAMGFVVASYLTLTVQASIR
jgi:hypothetical protein